MSQFRCNHLLTKSKNLENIFHFLRDVHSKIITLPFAITIAAKLEISCGFQIVPGNSHIKTKIDADFKVSHDFISKLKKNGNGERKN